MSDAEPPVDGDEPACFAMANRVEQWLALLERGRQAAHTLGDVRSEVWIIQQQATASLSAGRPEAAVRYLREAGELQRRPPARASRSPARAARQAGPDAPGPGGPAHATDAAREGHARSLIEPLWRRVALLAIGAVAAAGVGLYAGYRVGHTGGAVHGTTTQVRVTATVKGKPVTTFQTVTLPAMTFTSTTTAVRTFTTTTTVTVPSGSTSTPIP